MARYTVEPGRNICVDGKPLLYIVPAEGTRPAEADDMADLIGELLNDFSLALVLGRRRYEVLQVGKPAPVT